MQHNLKVGFIRVIKPYHDLDKREFVNFDALFSSISEYCEQDNISLYSLGDKLVSDLPIEQQTSGISEHKFDSDKGFIKGSRRKVKLAYHDAERQYVWQFIPFFYDGEELKTDVFEINFLIKINRILKQDNVTCLCFGMPKVNNILLEYQNQVVPIIDTLMDYYVDDNEISSNFVLPFHPMEHFLSAGIDFNDAMLVYQEWFAAFQATSAILKASKATYKIILGIPEWSYTPPELEELKEYIFSEGLEDIYRSPHHQINPYDKQQCDSVDIETLSAFDLGNIVTVITFQQQKSKKGQEYYYHVTGKSTPIDKLESDFRQMSLLVNRRNVDIDDAETLLTGLKKNKYIN